MKQTVANSRRMLIRQASVNRDSTQKGVWVPHLKIIPKRLRRHLPQTLPQQPQAPTITRAAQTLPVRTTLRAGRAARAPGDRSGSRCPAGGCFECPGPQARVGRETVRREDLARGGANEPPGKDVE